VLLLVLVVLVLLVVAADRVAQSVAENRVSVRLKTVLGTATAPQVDISGFPFLTQLARRSFSSVRVVADGVRPQGSTTTVKHIDLRLHDVTSSDNFATSTAKRVTGTATLDYAAVRALTGQPLAYAPPDQLEVSSPTTLMGVPVTAKVVGRPTVDRAQQTLSLADPQLSVAGFDIPQGTAQALLASVVKPAPIRNVPFGLQVSDVEAHSEGLSVGLAGDQVAFR